MSNNPTLLSQSGRLKFLFKDTVIYGGASAISKLFGILTFPVMARYFSIEDYGTIDAYNVLSALLVTLLVFGLDSSVARYFYQYEEVKEKKTVVSEALVVQIVLVFISIPFLFYFSDNISKFYSRRNDVKPLTNLIIWQIPFSLMINFSGNILKWNFKRTRYLIIQLGSTFFYVGSILIGIYFFKINIVDVFKIYLIIRLIFGVVGMIFIANWLTVDLRFNKIRPLLQYGAPYGVICVITSVLPALDRYFINEYLTRYDLGLYAAGTKVAYLIQFPIYAFQMAWGPFYLSLFKDPNASKTYNKVFSLFTIFICSVGLLIILFGKPVLLALAGAKYIEAGSIILPIVIGFIIMSMGWILGIGIDLALKSYLKLYSNICRLLVTWISILILIKPLGLIGVSIGFCFGYLISTALEAYLSYKTFNLNFELELPLFILVIVSCIGLVSNYASTNNVTIDVIIRSFVFVFFLLFIWAIPLKRRSLVTLLKKEKI
jgi:O-antigen/teichoic acid export membrane protein